jgi:hypothetical protein
MEDMRAMYDLTEARLERARPILERYRSKLIETRAFEPHEFENELRVALFLGYRELRAIVVEILEQHERYRYVAAYYMEHISANGVLLEFQEALAKAYGIRAYDSPELEDAGKAFWSYAPRE